MRVLSVIKQRLPRRWVLPASYLNQKLRGNLEPELRLLPSLVRRGSRGIDVGANVGYYSYVLSRICRHVEAFEPLPQCAEILEGFRAPNIHVHRLGLSATAGTAPLFVPVIDDVPRPLSASFECGEEGEHERLEVPVRTLDAFEFRNVSFIKIDVEGHEVHVLEGARQTLLRERPILLVEIEQRHHAGPIDEVFRRVVDLGRYDGSFLWQGVLRPLEEFRYEVHQLPFLGPPIGKGYVNNFIFRPAEK